MEDASNFDAVVFEMVSPAGYSKSAEDIVGQAPLPSQMPDKKYGPSVSTRELADDVQALDQELDAFSVSGQIMLASPPNSQRFFGRPEIHGVPAPHVEKRLNEVDWTGEVTEVIGNQSQYPFTAIGRLSYSIQGIVRQCTAWVVSERVVATAGHCVYSRNKNELADWTIFEPGYRAGIKGEQWVGVRGYVLEQWVEPQEGVSTSPYDFAFIVLDRPIASQTGVLGVRISNPDKPSATFSLGYPQKPTVGFAFDGNDLYASTGNVKSAGLGVLETENRLTEGSSGGPWLTKTMDGIVVTGINSNKPVGNDSVTYSPLIGQSFIELFSRVLSDMTGV